MGAKRLVMEGLAATAECTQMDIVGDKGNHSGPIELMTDILDRLGDARVSSQAMVMVGAKDIQSDILVVWNIEQSLVAKSPYWESDQGSGEAMAWTVVVESGPTHRHVR